MSVLRAEQATPPVTHHGEGAVWDESAGLLRCVDLLRGDVLSFDPLKGHLERQHIGAVAACVVPRAGGGLLVASERGFVLVGADGELAVLPDVWDDPSVRMNDGGCDPLGRFFCGSMAYDAEEGRGALHRLDPDHRVHEVLSGVSISNGIGWSPDGLTAFYVDTPTRRVDRLDWDPVAGELSNRRPAIDLADVDGLPDGLTVDADGGVWVALWGGSAVHRYVDGQLDLVVEVPVGQVTSCALGGPDLDRLFITTSAEGLADPEPAAGALFAVDTGVRGLPAPTFGG